jgi:hypothetical protein
MPEGVMMSSQLSLAVSEDRRPSFRSLSPVPFGVRVRDLWTRFTAAHRQRRILGLIALLWFFSAFDVVLTLWADRFTVFYEANPVARALLHNGMIKSVVLLKLVTLLAGSVLFWSTRHRRWTEGVLWVLACAYVVLMFQWSAYTANADELMHYRQMADFASEPVEGQMSYYSVWRRARQAERTHAAAMIEPREQFAQAGRTILITLTSTMPVHRSSKALQRFADLRD